QLGCQAGDNAAVAANCQYIFLGVKPQGMAAMLADIAPVLAARTDRFVLVTMAAGLTMDQIRSMAGGSYPVIRIMPNTPASIGAGMILYTLSDNVTDAECLQLTVGLSAAGRLDYLQESLMDAGSAVSGCGPAFVYLFIEALADGGVECGLPRAKALEYAAQTVCGAAQMVLESKQHPGILKDAVCSPGGTTIAGVHALERGAFRADSMNAVCAAYEKSKQFSK
ncbi:MAG: pyrroline-5-carboxylate reductase, partial [Oscillospiraceae bacterium]|nr:pyrroline-5-carboxylate reductase [Oscillospiraceae bacterium]